MLAGKTILLVVEAGARLAALQRRTANGVCNKVAIFPLTSNLRYIRHIVNILMEAGYEVARLNSALLIDKEVNRLGAGLPKWSAAIGAAQVGGASITESLRLKGERLSGWWLGLISEKNPAKTDAFLRIAQVEAVRKILAEGEFNECVIGVRDKPTREAIIHVCQKFCISHRAIGLASHFDSQVWIKGLLRNLGSLGDIIGAVIVWIQYCWRGWLARRVMGPLSGRSTSERSILFVTYFPALDMELAKHGIFRNKYGVELQSLLRSQDRQVTWLLMCVKNLYGADYGTSVRLARQLVDHGERMFILEEFLKPGDAARGLFLWLRQARQARRLYKAIDSSVLFSGLISAECEPLVKYLWTTSLLGTESIRGILFYLSFQRFFRDFQLFDDCLYYCEMQAWEKALIAAKNSENPKIRAIGFQHASTPRHFWPYFFDATETEMRKTPDALPLPDVLAANGHLTHAMLAQSQYPELQEVEAVRYLYLQKLMKLNQRAERMRQVLLIAGSIDRTESLALLEMVIAAFPRGREFEIRFKGHPSMPFEPLFDEVGIDVTTAGYNLCKGDIVNCLEGASAVLISASTVGMEALALGCEVIVPVFPDSIQMNPVADFPDRCRIISTPEDLRIIMDELGEKVCSHDTEESRHFVRSYWNLDPALPKWSFLLAQQQ